MKHHLTMKIVFVIHIEPMMLIIKCHSYSSINKTKPTTMTSRRIRSSPMAAIFGLFFLLGSFSTHLNAMT
ncbi:hypothetical protein BLOT_002266, partial [Blomia tropicalis]